VKEVHRCMYYNKL